MSKLGAIGFFDSGVGGLTIWKEVVKLLPLEDTIYIADSLNAPYGTKSKAEVHALSIKHTQSLIDRGAKIVVVACNTATTQAIEMLRSRFEIPFIGIEPAVKPAALKSLTKVVGVLATNGTLESELFNKTKDHFTNEVQVITQVGEGLVKAIENGELGSVHLRSLLKKHLSELTKYPIDHLVLGCTHYPLLIPEMRKILNANIKIIDSGIPVALQTKKVLSQLAALNGDNKKGKHLLLSSGNLNVLQDIAGKLPIGPGSSVDYSLYQSE